MDEVYPALALDFLVALGTHPALDDDALNRLFVVTPQERASSFAGIRLITHAWKTPEALVTLGTIPASDISRLSDGLLQVSVPVRINRPVMEYDHLLICGAVFPHEVAGFSGGNKYFFPDGATTLPERALAAPTDVRRYVGWSERDVQSRSGRSRWRRGHPIWTPHQ